MARPFRGWWIAFAMLPGVAVELSSCSDDPPADAATTAPTDAAVERRDAPVADAAVEDAADAARVPPPVLPGCIGTSLPLVPAGERPLRLGEPRQRRGRERRGRAPRRLPRRLRRQRLDDRSPRLHPARAHPRELPGRRWRPRRDLLVQQLRFLRALGHGEPGHG